MSPFQKNSYFWASLLAFIVLNCFLYYGMVQYHAALPFQTQNYEENAHHYLPDMRSTGGSFNFLRALGQYDAQWYLKIADSGYPKHPTVTDINQKNIQDGLTYAFLPLYPLLIAVIHRFIPTIELSAFFLSWVLLVVNFISLYAVISRFYSQKIAIKTIFLLFLFPFSIFYRSYFTEGLFLFELIWFSYFLIQRKWPAASVLCGLLLVTHLRGIFIWMVLISMLFSHVSQRKQYLTVQKKIMYITISILPFLIWILFCYIQTGNGFYFYIMQTIWIQIPIYAVFLHNLVVILHFFNLPLHYFHYSQIDVVTILGIPILLFLSRKTIKKELWLISFALWIGAVLTHDTISFTRVQIVSFPLFLFLGQKLKGIWFGVAIVAFSLALFATSLYFINWYWVG